MGHLQFSSSPIEGIRLTGDFLNRSASYSNGRCSALVGRNLDFSNATIRGRTPLRLTLNIWGSSEFPKMFLRPSNIKNSSRRTYFLCLRAYKSFNLGSNEKIKYVPETSMYVEYTVKK